jgi:hypothetical protein
MNDCCRDPGDIWFNTIEEPECIERIYLISVQF